MDISKSNALKNEKITGVVYTYFLKGKPYISSVREQTEVQYWKEATNNKFLFVRLCNELFSHRLMIKILLHLTQKQRM